MVMPYLQGVTLRDARKAMAHAPDEAWVLGVIHPMLDALELLHREGVYHRDIAPDNILLPPVGQPILLDFGAARHVISDRTQSLTAILKPSYAPIEQYAEMTQMRQGPWTDLYALGAVMHFLLFGVPPAPATARAMQDDAEPIEQRVVPGVSQRLLDAVGWTLRVRPLERPQNVAELRAALKGLAPVPAKVQHAGHGGQLPASAVAASAVTFQPTMMVDAADPQATRINTAQPPPVPRAQPAPPPKPAASMPATPQRLVAATVPPLNQAAAPARKRGLIFAALAAAVVVAGVVLWQFVGLLGGSRAPVLATAAPASVAASAAPVAVPVVQPVPPPVVAAVPAPSLAASTQAATDAALAAVAQSQGLTVSGKAASADAGKSVALLGASASTAVPSLSSASAARAKPVPAAASRFDGSAVSNGVYADAAASRPADARARPVPAAAPREPVAVVAAPVAAAPTGAATAREVCGSRLFIALAICMDRECEHPRYRDQPECVRVLEVKQKREQQR